MSVSDLQDGVSKSDVEGPSVGVMDAAAADRPAPGGLRGGASRPIPPKYYRIGEVVDYSGVSRQTIHNYTTMGLLRECGWTPGGHRLYDESVFLRLDRINEMKSRHKSLQEIREHFEQAD